jgi:hypothetical protein
MLVTISCFLIIIYKSNKNNTYIYLNVYTKSYLKVIIPAPSLNCYYLFVGRHHTNDEPLLQSPHTDCLSPLPPESVYKHSQHVSASHIFCLPLLCPAFRLAICIVDNADGRVLILKRLDFGGQSNAFFTNIPALGITR